MYLRLTVANPQSLQIPVGGSVSGVVGMSVVSVVPVEVSVPVAHAVVLMGMLVSGMMLMGGVRGKMAST